MDCRCPDNPPPAKPPKFGRKRRAVEENNKKIKRPKKPDDDEDEEIPILRKKLPPMNPRILLPEDLEPIADDPGVNPREEFLDEPEPLEKAKIWRYLIKKSGPDIIKLSDVILDYLVVVKELRHDNLFKKIAADASVLRKEGYNYNLAMINSLIENKDLIF